MDTATRTVHRDALRTRIEKQSVDKDRWQKHYHGFATMAEEQTRQLRKYETSSKRLEESLEESNKAKARAIESVASSMAAASHGTLIPLPEEDERFQPLERNMASMWDELVELRRTYWTLDTAMQDHSYEVRRDYVRKQALNVNETMIAEFAVNISKLQVSSMKHDELTDQVAKLREQLEALPAPTSNDKLDDRIAKIQENFDDRIVNIQEKLDARIVKIQEKLDLLDGIDYRKVREEIVNVSANASVRDADSQRFKEDHESHVKDFQKFKDDVNEQMDKIKELSDFVTGDENSDEKSLYDIVQEGVRKSNKHAEALQNLNNEMSELDNLKEQFKSISTSVTKLEANPSNQHSTSSDHKTSGRLDMEVAILREDVARITREQLAKDDIMAEEVDRLGSLLVQKDAEVERLSQQLNEQRTMFNDRTDQISKLHSQAITELSREVSSNQPPVNEIRLSEESTLRPKIEELEASLKQFKEFSLEKMSNTEIFVASQEQRFNNLTTEHMSKSMINQMQRMYPPHPGNVMAEINQIKGHQQALSEHWSMLERRLQVITEYVAPADEIPPQKHTIPDLQSALRTVSNKVEEVSQLHQGSSSFIKETNALVLNHSTKIEALETDITAMKQEHLSAVEASKHDLQAMKTNIEEIGATTIKECSNFHGELETLSERLGSKSGSPTHLHPSIITNDSKRRLPAAYTSDNSVSPLNKPPRSKIHLHPDDSDNEHSPSPNSRQRGGSVRSAASAAKTKLANTAVTINGNHSPTRVRKSRGKRDRSEGSESDWHPKKASRNGD